MFATTADSHDPKFASAYIVFTSENLKAFVLAVSKGTPTDLQHCLLNAC